MKITAIKAQVKNPDRVSIYVDEKYAFSLNPTQLLEEKLRHGLEIDEGRLAELKKVSEVGKLYDRLLQYALIRPRSEREAIQYCQRKKFATENVQPIIEKLKTRGYISDAAFARAWVESRHLTKPTSERRLKLELKQKGVADELITQALGASEYDSLEALRAVAAKKLRQPRYRDLQKITQYLLRQGFAYDDIKRVLGEQAASAPDEL